MSEPTRPTDPPGQPPDVPAVELNSTRAAEPGRRSLLVASGVIAGCVGAMGAIPALTLLAAPILAPKDASGGRWVPTGTQADSVGEEPISVSYTYRHQEGWYEATRDRRVLVMRRGESDFTVFDTECTHLGCAVSWQAAKERFFCPCHDGMFDLNGRPIAGPPSEPLKQLPARVSPTGELEVLEV